MGGCGEWGNADPFINKQKIVQRMAIEVDDCSFEIHLPSKTN